MPGSAWADVFSVSFAAPGVEALGTAQPGVFAVESFDRGSSFTSITNFGGSTVFSGRYTGAFSIIPADQYGGAGGRGWYAATYDPAGFTLSLAHRSVVPGINTFALDWSALDGGNALQFLRDGAVVASYTPSALITALGPCSGSNPYCGNPTTGQDSSEQFAFVTFTDQSGYFDAIHFQAGGGGGFETDNHTIGYADLNAAQITPVAEPASLALLGTGVLALGLFRRVRALRRSE